jgi:hypothetical protein
MLLLHIVQKYYLVNSSVFFQRFITTGPMSKWHLQLSHATHLCIHIIVSTDQDVLQLHYIHNKFSKTW